MGAMITAFQERTEATINSIRSELKGAIKHHMEEVLASVDQRTHYQKAGVLTGSKDVHRNAGEVAPRKQRTRGKTSTKSSASNNEDPSRDHAVWI
jgi:hypothetical protein